MKVTPVSSPQAIRDTSTPEHVRTARAVAAFNKAAATSNEAPAQQQQATNHPQGFNQNAISAEEMGAVKQKSQIEQVAAEALEVAQASTEETAVTTETAATETETKTDPVLSRQFAQLARQEKALRAKAQAQQQALQAREDALKAKEAQIQASEQQYKQGYISLDQLKADALGVLANAGVSYDELTQQMLNQQPTDPRLNAHISRLEAKIKQLEEANETNAKTYQEQQKSAYDAAIKQIRTDAKQLVYTDPNFETIKATNSVNDVVELIEKTYQKDGIILSVEEAAQQVEDYLVDEYMKVTRIEKIKKRISEVSAPTQKVQTKQTQATAAQTDQAKTQPQMKTLTNAAASTRKLSARERALLAFKGELK